MEDIELINKKIKANYFRIEQLFDKLDSVKDTSHSDMLDIIHDHIYLHDPSFTKCEFDGFYLVNRNKDLVQDYIDQIHSEIDKLSKKNNFLYETLNNKDLLTENQVKYFSKRERNGKHKRNILWVIKRYVEIKSNFKTKEDRANHIEALYNSNEQFQKESGSISAETVKDYIEQFEAQ